MTRTETCALTHPLIAAHSPTPNVAGTRVYVVCNWEGCALRRDVATAVWEAEAARRREAPPATGHPEPAAGSTD